MTTRFNRVNRARTSCAALAFCLILLSAACGGPNLTDPETRFQSVIGTKPDPQVRLVTDQSQYNPLDAMTYGVVNQSPRTVWFRDQSFDLQAYKYEPISMRWLPVEIAGFVATPQITAIPPLKTGEYMSSWSISVKKIRSEGKLRLVVEGWTNPSNPQVSQVAAYTDIEIGIGNPSYFGEWISDGMTRRAKPAGENTYASFGFKGHQVVVRMRKGPEYGAAQVRLDGYDHGPYCNYAATDSIVEIPFSISTDNIHFMLVYPLADKNCNSGNGETGIVGFEIINAIIPSSLVAPTP